MMLAHVLDDAAVEAVDNAANGAWDSEAILPFVVSTIVYHRGCHQGMQWTVTSSPSVQTKHVHLAVSSKALELTVKVSTQVVVRQ